MRRFNFLLTVALILNQLLITITSTAARPSSQSNRTGPSVDSILPPKDNKGIALQQDPDQAVKSLERARAQEYSDYLGFKLYGQEPSISEISHNLCNLLLITGQRTAFIYVDFPDNKLHLQMILPLEPIEGSCPPLPSLENNEESVTHNLEIPFYENTLSEVKSEEILAYIKTFRREIRKKSERYLEPAKQLYDWLIKPLEIGLEKELPTDKVDILVFSMSPGMRLFPIAALHDGEKFLVEKYATALVPSFGLTDVGYSDVRQTSVLAMGASEFLALPSLPAVPTELQIVTSVPWQGERFPEDKFTIGNFVTQNKKQQFAIVHLATHAEFKDKDDSYIQFYEPEKLQLEYLGQIADELGWRSTEVASIELLVLSACQTALGNEEAELGFSGLAIQAGVKSVVASLWKVLDVSPLGLMGEFYLHLSQTPTPTKAQALRQSQLAMLQGTTSIKNGQLWLSGGEPIPLPSELVDQGDFINFKHPYFWSSFTLIGNWN